MLLDVSVPSDLGDPGDEVAAAERRGYAAAWVGETTYDPLVSLAVAATRTDNIRLGTGVAVAFARNPMSTAVAANQLQLLTRGRLLLGLGSQVKSHISHRFSMPWSNAAPRMREFVMATRAIWTSWNEGTPLDFRGDFYSHTLMTPFFDPGPNPYGTPEVWLAAVGERMTAVAGEVADGLLCHGFTTERYLREVTVPALASGAASAGRSIDEIALSVSPFVVTGGDAGELAEAAAPVRQQLAFYASTPSYRNVLDLHGWGEMHTDLLAMSRAGRWQEMAGLIDDEVLRTFAIVGEPGQVAGMLEERFGDVASRVSLHTPGLKPEQRDALIGELLSAS